MVFDYFSTFRVGQKLFNKQNQSFHITKITSNSLTLSNGHTVQMYSDNNLYYQFYDPKTYKEIFKPYFVESQQC